MANCRALIIEDEYFLAKNLEDALRSFGVRAIALVGDLDEALDQVARGGFEFAVVDINLRGREAFGVADELKRKRLPFVFCTGYGANVIPDRFAGVKVWEKPFDEFKLARDVVRFCQRAA